MPNTMIRKIYDSYLEKALAAERNRKPTDGMFGIGKKAGDDPCHTEFAEALEAALNDYAAEQHDSAELRLLLEYMYSMPKAHEDPKSIYWMLIAVHGLTLQLISGLSQQDAAALRKQYAVLYRRWERLPVQQQVLIYFILKNQARTLTAVMLR